MTVYYNEIEPDAAEWLEHLIAAGHVADGIVDRRSIRDVRPEDLRGYSQHHFFAGIGGWSLALRLAGWPDDRPIWTGSCPCQPFSAAGKRRGVEDERHLWPVFGNLIGECSPSTVVGEQVASKDGRTWLSAVFSDLEGMGYAVAGADLCAAGIGAPHIRQRLYWGGAKPLADADLDGARRFILPERNGEQIAGREAGQSGVDLDGRGDVRGVEHPPGFGRQQRGTEPIGRGAAGGRREMPWTACDWVPCSDGCSRPIEPGTFPLAHGVSGRVGLLRGYGNAIVPQVAAAFVEAFQESLQNLGSHID